MTPEQHLAQLERDGLIPELIKDARYKPAFDFDCLSQIVGIDPLAPKVQFFDWEAVFRDLDGDTYETSTEAMAHALGQVLRWIVEGTDVERIGYRAVALQKALSSGQPS